jgi:glutamate/tyrosine decarboxylase-like PLP-dependent enzyme
MPRRTAPGDRSNASQEEAMPPDPRETAPLLEAAAGLAARYLEALPSRPVGAAPAAVARLREALAVPLPEKGRAPLAVLEELDALGSPATVATAGPRYFGFVTGGALPATVGAGMLALAWDQNAFSTTSSPAGALLEEAALRWLADLLGLPFGCGGSLVTGATLANVSALAAARHALLAREGWDVESQGLAGSPPLRVVVGAEVHASVRKALGLLGLGRDRVSVLPTDVEGRIRADALPALEGPAIVCAQAGNVNSGASDPFPALRAWCDAHDAWLHVDGAFGLFAAASPRLRWQVEGVERADSWATDAHKWLNVPYDCGVVFVRDPAALRGAMSLDAAYLPAQAEREPFHYAPELSRRARGVEVWAALRNQGREGVTDLVERCCRHARQLADALAAAGYEILNEVVLNQVVVALGSEAAAADAIARVQADGTCWCGPTVWRGRSGLRISVSGWATSEDDVERSAHALLRVFAAAKVPRSGARG